MADRTETATMQRPAPQPPPPAPAGANDAGETSEDQPRRFRKRLLLIFGLGALLVAGTLYYLHIRGYESTDDAYLEGHVIQISPRVAGHIEKVYVEDNQPVKAGDLLLELDPRDYQAKLDEMRGQLEEAKAKGLGGQINIGLTSDTSQAGVTQARSGVEQAQSGRAMAEAQVSIARSSLRQADAEQGAAEAGVAQARADVAAAQAEQTRAGKDLERYRDLVKRNAVSRQQLDVAEESENTARAKLDARQQAVTAAEAKVTAAKAGRQAAQDSLAAASSQLKQTQARIGEAGGKLASANTAPQQVLASQSQLKALEGEIAMDQGKVAQAELNLSYTKIYAPENGRVTRKSAEAGAYVQVGQALMALVPEKVWVVANFKETQLTHMHPGQPVEIDIDAYPGLDLRGKVDSIQSGTGARFSLLPPENATGNFVKVVQRVPVKIVFDQLPGDKYALAPGMSVLPRVNVKQ